jgi:hypothetical protein
MKVFKQFSPYCPHTTCVLIAPNFKYAAAMRIRFPSSSSSSYGFAAIIGSWPLFQFIDPYTQLVGLLGRGIGTSQGLYLHKAQRKHRIRVNTHRHPCLEWDSNPRSHCLRGRRQFMPQTTQLLSSACHCFCYLRPKIVYTIPRSGI